MDVNYDPAFLMLPIGQQHQLGHHHHHHHDGGDEGSVEVVGRKTVDAVMAREGEMLVSTGVVARC